MLVSVRCPAFAFRRIPKFFPKTARRIPSGPLFPAPSVGLGSVDISFSWFGKNMIPISCRTKSISPPPSRISGITACPMGFRQDRFSDRGRTPADTDTDCFFNKSEWIRKQFVFIRVHSWLKKPDSIPGSVGNPFSGLRRKRPESQPVRPNINRT